MGQAALVWIALDEPGTMTEVVDRVAATALKIDSEALGAVVEGGWVISSTSDGSSRQA